MATNNGSNVLYGPADGAYYHPGTHRSQILSLRTQDGKRFTPWADYTWLPIAGGLWRWVFVKLREQPPPYQDKLEELRQQEEHRDRP